MRVTLASAAGAELPVDALAVPVVSGQAPGQPLIELDRRLDGLLQATLESGEHRGRLFQVLPVRTGGKITAPRVLLYGLGSSGDLDGQRLRYAHHEMVRAARTYGYRRLGILATAPLDAGTLTGVIEGSVMGNWERRSKQTSGPDRVAIDELTLTGFEGARERDVAAAFELGQATNRARELQNLPPNELTPEALAAEARRIAERTQAEIEVLGPAELRAGGYNLLLGVAQGSALPPRLVRLRHRSATGAGPTLALIGKGITFDTGGISLKEATNMHLMKADMAGAAAVLAAFDVIASWRLPLDVIAVVAATENMPGGSAQRPGDVITSANGKTVEINNTDAEGRLVLADAITHAIRQGATHLVDVATLTGGAKVAIGHAGTAAVAGNDELWHEVAEAALQAGDRVWRLPIYPEYRVLLQSRIADLRNAGYGEASTITGGMFIQEFTQGKPWVHLDIAASSWNTNDDLTSVPRGPLGTGTRILARLAERMAVRSR